MKKSVLLVAICLGSVFLSACLPIIQGASTVGSPISVGSDRRSAGTILDDRLTYLSLFKWTTEDEQLADAHLNFLVHNATALITGEVADNALRQYAASEAKRTHPKIVRVVNELQIGPNTSLLSRAKDSAITTQVELLFYDQEVFHPAHVRVITENQVVYLMGMVTEREANQAAKVATKAKGVRKMVKVIEYLQSLPEAEVHKAQQQQLQAQKTAEITEKKAALQAQKADIQRQINQRTGETGTSF